MYPIVNNEDSLNTFYGREHEAQLLSASLENKIGGTVLVAGDRGSGKTSLINEVLKREFRTKSSKLGILYLSRQFYVKIDLPFIPKHLLLSNADEEEKELNAHLTSTVLRALTQSLVNENEKRRIAALPLGTYYYRPIGYNNELRKLDRLTRYISIKESKKGNLKAGKSLAVSSEYKSESELDLSDTIIEVRLRRLLQTYSKYLTFVFVFDELDKREDDLLAIHLATYLKNLFTQCGAHFIFATTEHTYRYIQDQTAAQPYSEAHTLFTNKVLVNQMKTDAFEDTFKKFFGAATIEKMVTEKVLPNMTLLLEWSSRNHIYDALSVFKKSIADNSLNYEILKREIGPDSSDFVAGFQLLINYLVDKHDKLGDEYYSKFLYRSLRLVADNIRTTSNMIVYRLNALSALFGSAEFTDITEETSEKDNLSKYAPPKKIVSDAEKWKNDWRYYLYKLPRNKLESIEEAVLEFIWILDRISTIKIEKIGNGEAFSITYPAGIISVSKLSSIDNEAKSAMYYKDINKLHSVNNVEIQAIELSESLNSKFLNTFGSEVWRYYDAGFIETDGDKPTLKISSDRYRFSIDIQSYMAVMQEQAQADLDNNLLENIQNELLGLTSTSSYVEGDNNYRIVRLFNGGTYKHVIIRLNGTQTEISNDLSKNFVTQPYNQDPDPFTIINIQDSVVDQLRVAGQQKDDRVKNYKLASDWSSINSTKKNIIRHVEKFIRLS